MTHFFAPLGIFPPMSPSHGCQVFVTHFFVSLRSFQLCCRHTAVIRPRLSSFGANFFASLRFSTNLPLHSCQVSVPTFFAPLRIIPNMLPSHGRDHSCQASMTHFLCLLELSQLCRFVSSSISDNFFAPLRIIPNMLSSHGRDHCCQVSVTYFLLCLEFFNHAAVARGCNAAEVKRRKSVNTR